MDYKKLDIKKLCDSIALNFENELTKDSQYLVFDDEKNKRWIIYGVKSPFGEIDRSAPFHTMPYGQIACETYNTLVEVSETSPHTEKLRKMYTKDIGEDAVNETILSCQKVMKDFPTDFDIWKNTLLSESAEAVGFIDKLGIEYIWRLFCFAPIDNWLYTIFEAESRNPGYLYGLDYDNMIRIFHEKVMVDCGMYQLYFDDGSFSFCRCYSTQSYFNAFYYDYLYTLQSIGKKKRNKVVECPRCHCLFYSLSNNYKYCPQCSRKEIALENRNKSVRRIHKKIQDKLHGRMVRKNNPLPVSEYNEFLEESNFYWDVIRGKDIEPTKKYSDSIKTEKQYEQWLTDKLNSL